MIGQKLAINEFCRLSQFCHICKRVALWMLKPWRLFLSRCAVSLNFGSIGVVVVSSAVAPHRAQEIAQLGLRALAAATLSNLMSATIAGFFIGLA
ncbi:nucleoside transporter C-terminal domain-containing protein [Escherichia coli]